MPARVPFLARAPLRSLSPVFGRRGSGLRAFVEANGSGQRKEARAFGAIWIFFFSLLADQVNGPTLLHVPWRSSSGRSSGDKRPGQFGCYQGQIGCSGGAARGGSEGTEPAGVALGGMPSRSVESWRMWSYDAAVGWSSIRRTVESW